MLSIGAIECLDYILDKIESKHGVTEEEVNEACYSSQRFVRRGEGGAYLFYSRTEAGRYVLVVLRPLGGDVWRLITAREMTDRERRGYRERKGIP